VTLSFFERITEDDFVPPAPDGRGRS